MEYADKTLDRNTGPDDGFSKICRPIGPWAIDQWYNGPTTAFGTQQSLLHGKEALGLLGAATKEAITGSTHPCSDVAAWTEKDSGVEVLRLSPEEAWKLAESGPAVIDPSTDIPAEIIGVSQEGSLFLLEQARLGKRCPHCLEAIVRHWFIGCPLADKAQPLVTEAELLQRLQDGKKYADPTEFYLKSLPRAGMEF